MPRNVLSLRLYESRVAHSGNSKQRGRIDDCRLAGITKHKSLASSDQFIPARKLSRLLLSSEGDAKRTILTAKQERLCLSAPHIAFFAARSFVQSTREFCAAMPTGTHSFCSSSMRQH